MKFLLELKTNIISLVEKYEYYALCLSRLIVMLGAFLLVKTNICYNATVDNIFIPLILAVFCAIIPMAFGTVILALYILMNLTGLGMEVVAVVGAIFLLTYLLYFRFSKGTAYREVLAGVLNCLKIPYLLPVICGLKGAPGNVVSVLSGTLCYYLLMGIKANETVYLTSAEITAVDKVVLTLNQIVKNKELWIILAAFFITTVVVYLIRRSSAKYAWRTASITGVVVNLVLILSGKLILGQLDGLVWVVIGSVISIIIVLGYEFVFMNLDYSRVEHTQFEDDNYYYYVKAIPKISMQVQKKSVKRFNQKPEMVETEEEQLAREQMEKEQLAKELEIDSSLLK